MLLRCPPLLRPLHSFSSSTMGFLSWFCRSVPGLSFLAWALLAFLALGHRLPIWSKAQPTSATELQHLTTSQLLYVIYTVLCHFLGCVGFPLRLCWSVWHISGEVKRARFEAEMLSIPSEKAESEKSLSLSAHSSRDSTADAPLSRASTPRTPNFDPQDQILHAIIIPSYKEDIDTMRETLSVLASHGMAKTSYDVSPNQTRALAEFV